MDKNLLIEKRELLAKYQEMLKAREHQLDFMKYTWIKGEDDPLIIGYHTIKICQIIDRAIEKFNRGISSFIRIKIHQRAGKSDIVSRYLPPRLVGLYPDSEVMCVSYNTGKATGFSRFGRRILNSRKFYELFPRISLAGDKSAAGDWEVCEDQIKTGGKVYASGLQSGLTGGGYHFGILDDYCAGRKEAESQAYRNSMWDCFTNDFLTRRAPTSVTIVLATQWHEDDIHGRIEKKNDQDNERDYAQNFPKFEEISFPATVSGSDYESDEEWINDWSKDSDGQKKEYLFEERYSKNWYLGMYAGLGPYASSAMMDCDPIPRHGGVLDITKIKYHDKLDEFPNRELDFIRVWDYAHTEKKKTNKDPDWTAGTLLAFRKIGYNLELKLPICDLWIKDYAQTRESAVKRDKFIIEVMSRDGAGVRQVVETSLDSLDGYYYLRERVRGSKKIYSVNIGSKNKLARCEPLEPIFDLGEVHLIKGDWNKPWSDQVKRFDGSGKTHDEAIDNMTAGYKFQIISGSIKNLKVRIGR
jgi:phage terminase large subunit-like protein